MTKPGQAVPHNESQYALVTGASSGIGEEFARQLAARGYSLVLAARTLSKLEELRTELLAAHAGISVDVIACDLSLPGAAAALMQEISSKKIEIDVLINNAGFGLFGDFAELDLNRQSEMIALNMATLSELAHLCLGPMLERGRGSVLNIASTIAFFPMPYFAVYSASKAYVLSLSRALYAECRPRGVHVMAVCPGATQTNFFNTAQMDAFAAGVRMQTSQQAVTEAMRAWEKRHSIVVCGWFNRVGATLAPFLPKKLFVILAARYLLRLQKGRRNQSNR